MSEKKPDLPHDAEHPGRRDFLVKTGIAAGAWGPLQFSGAAQAADDAAAPGHVHPSAPGFQCAGEPPRVRKSFYDLTDVELRQLCRAVGHMRNGSKGHPLSVASPLQWDQYVLMHARHCTEAAAGTVDQVHWSWFFLPWHRAYLWFLERHLANIVTTILGEDGTKFALPYWDWITHKEIPNTRERAAKGIPSPLFAYDLSKEDMVSDDGLGFDNQALWDGNRKPSVQQPTMDPANERSLDSKQHVEETILFMGQEYLGYMLELDFESFAGMAVPAQSPIAAPDGMGVLEHYPHNNGHDWVGSRLGKNRNMGSLRYAAADPIFFMHHANIDRVWSLYRGVQPDPDAPWGPNGYVWGKQPYTFVDIDGKDVTVTVSDVVKCMTNVTYQEPAVAGLQARAVQFAAVRRAQLTAAPAVTLAQPANVLGPGALTVQVAAQPALRLLEAAPAAAAPVPSLLVIETGPIPYPGKFTVKVFVDKTDANARTSIHDPHYVGRIRSLDSDGRAKESDPNISHTFSLLVAPGKSSMLLKQGKGFSITLVAQGPAAGDETFRIPIRKISLKTFK